MKLTSLRHRLFLIAVLALAPALVLTVWSTVEAFRDARQDAEREMEIEVERAAMSMERMVATTAQLLLDLQNDSVVKMGGDKGAVTARFVETMKAQPFYTNVGITDARGNLLISAVPQSKEVYLGDRKYFQEARETGGFSVGEYIVSRTTGRESIVFAVPRQGVKGKAFEGILYIDINLDHADKIFKVPMSPGYSMVVLDYEGRVLFRWPENEKWRGKLDSAVNIALMRAQASGTNEGTGVDGVKRVRFWRQLVLPGRKGAYGFVRVGVEPAQIYAPAYRYLWRNVALMVLAAGVSLLLAGHLHQKMIVEGITRLREASRRMAEGDLGARSGLQMGGDEVSELGVWFDRMGQRVQEREQRLGKISRELRVLCDCNEALVRATGEQALLEDICRLICQAGYRMAWVGYKMEDEARSVKPMAWSGVEEGYLKQARITWADTERGRGPVGRCVRMEQTYYVADWRTDERVLPWREEALKRGYMSALALPLRNGMGKTMGVLTIYAGEVKAFGDGEVKLMEELAGDMAFGIEALRMRSRREVAERALKVSEEKYRAVVEQSVDGIMFIKDTIVDCNQGAMDILGYERGGILGKMPADFAPPTVNGRDAQKWQEELIRRAYAGETLKFQWQCLRKDGRLVEIDASLKAIQVEGERFLLTVGHDITEQKRVQAALREERMFSEALLNSLPGIFYLFSYPELKLLRWNANHAKVLGLSPGEMRGRDFNEWHLPENREAIRQAVEVAMEKGSNTAETPIVTKDGKTIPYLLTGIRFEAMGQQYLMGIGVDITERKKAEEAAEAASKAKDQFIAVLSHELRTPLTPVLAKVELLQRDKCLSADLQRALEMIRRNVELEAHLIGDLLDITTIIRGELVLECDITDAHKCLQEVLEVCAPQINDKGHEVTVEMNAPHCHLLADPVRLRQIFWNLLGNAVKYTPAHGHIWVETSNDEEGLLIVRIRDNGIGIRPEVMAEIFKPFVQGEQSLRRRFGGLGLGLSISKALVEAHRGVLKAESAGVNQGAMFTVELPTERRISEPKKVVPEVVATGRALRILLVEDNEDTLRVMVQLLKLGGHEVRTADTIQTAMEVAAGWEYELLVSDIGLPDGTGWELLEKLSSQRPIKAVALSGYVTEEDKQRSKAAGFMEHLAKPISPEQLERVIAQNMG